MSGPSGVAPIVDDRTSTGVSAVLCAHCATPIRYWPDEFTWRHMIVGLGHAPEPLTAGPIAPASAVPELTESELRAMWGDR